jgi:hypothetical protein
MKKKRICPLLGGKGIAASECGRIRAEGSCPPSCAYNQRARQQQQQQELERQSRRWLEASGYNEERFKRLDDAHGVIMYHIGEALLHDPFADNEDLVQALEMLYQHYATGQPIEEYLNRARGLVDEIQPKLDKFRQPPYALAVNEVKHVCAYLLFLLYSYDAQEGTSGAFIKYLRKTTMDFQREIDRKAKGSEQEEAEEEESEQAPTADQTTEQTAERPRLLMPGQSENTEDTTEEKGEKPRLWMPGDPLR